MMEMKKSCLNLGAIVSLVAGLGLTGQVAHADPDVPDPVISASAVNATATLSNQAFPYFVLNFNTDFDLAGFEVTVEYAPTKLSFSAASTRLTIGSDTFKLPEVLAMMEAASVIPGSDPDFIYSPGQADFGSDIHTGSFSFNGTYLGEPYLVPAGTSVVMMGVFNLQPGFDAGDTQVRVFGMAIDPSLNGENFDVTATVAAVPEPETWLMLLGGLGLIAARVRRRNR